MGMWAAQPRQDKWLVDYAEVYESFYGGAAGGGKTDAILIYQAARRMAYPGSNGLILRRRFTDMSQPGAILDRFRELFADEMTYNANSHEATWKNGSVTRFGYMDSEQDRLQYQGSQFDDISFDELTQFTYVQYSYMFSRARVRKQELADMGMRAQIRATGNPGGVGHAWVKARFVDVCEDMIFSDEQNKFFDEINGKWIIPTRAYVPAKVTDNYALMRSSPEYRQGLLMLPEAERRALLDGDWDLFEGQFFAEWRKEVHVTEPVRPPAHWRRWIGFDWGYAAPWVALFFAQDPDTKQIVVYRELTGRRMNDSQIARAIVEASRGERIDVMFADPSIWTRKNETSTADILGSADGWTIRLEPANNDRIEGWRRVHEYLAFEADGFGGIVTSPLLTIARNCVYTIRSLPTLIHDDIKVEDLDTTMDDHAADALRYGLVSRPVHVLSDVIFKSVVLLPR